MMEKNTLTGPDLNSHDKSIFCVRFHQKTFMIPMPPPTDNFSHVQRLVPATKNGHHHSFHSTTVSEWKFNPPVFAATFISETMYKIVVMCNHVHFMTRGCGQCCWQTKFWKRAFRSIHSIQQHIFFQCYICLRSKQSSWEKKNGAMS